MISLIELPWKVPNPLSPGHGIDQGFLLKILFAPLNKDSISLLLIIIASILISIGITLLKITLSRSRTYL